MVSTFCLTRVEILMKEVKERGFHLLSHQSRNANEVWLRTLKQNIRFRISPPQPSDLLHQKFFCKAPDNTKS